MGLQNAVVRSIGVADITTTVVTQTIIGIAMDSTLAGGTNTRVRRRVTAVVVMFAGALIGAVIVLRLGVPAALIAAASRACHRLGLGMEAQTALATATLTQ